MCNCTSEGASLAAKLMRASILRWASEPALVRSKPELRANRLDIVAVGIDQERGEVGRAVVGAGPCATVIAASGLHALAVKFLDRRVIGRAERDVGASSGRSVMCIKPERRFALGPETRAAVVARTQHISERRQCRRVEAHAGVETFNLQSDVVVHDDLLNPARSGNARSGDQPSQCRARRSWKILRIPREASRNLRGETPAARWKVRTKLERSPNPTS